MAFEHEQRQALHMLEGIEQGSMSASQAAGLLGDADPTLVYFIFTWLRERYTRHAAAEGVLGRVAEICTQHPAIARRIKEGGADPVVSWFEDAYSYRELQAREFIALVVEKLES